jgi:cytochrome d ubiquinol oxidase subunit I
MLMIAMGVWALFARWRGTLYGSRPLLRCALAMGPAGVIAILAGWMTTEIGRQPWVVYGVMRTADAVSPVGAVPVAVTLALFVVVYLAVFGAGIGYMLRLIRVGPVAQGGAVEGGPGRSHQPMRPMSAADAPVAAKG